MKYWHGSQQVVDTRGVLALLRGHYWKVSAKGEWFSLETLFRRNRALYPKFWGFSSQSTCCLWSFTGQTEKFLTISVPNRRHVFCSIMSFLCYFLLSVFTCMDLSTCAIGFFLTMKNPTLLTFSLSLWLLSSSIGLWWTSTTSLIKWHTYLVTLSSVRAWCGPITVERWHKLYTIC